MLRNFLLVFGLYQILFLSSCSSDESNQSVSDADTEFQFEIVDSLTVDYLGTPLLCDFSSNNERILYFNSRNSEFLITDSKGEIVNQFSKSGDIPDNPGTLADRPIFYDDQMIVANGSNGIFAYTIEGENLWKIEHEQSINVWMSVSSGRNMFVVSPEKYFTVINYDNLEASASQDSLYANWHALKIVDLEAQSAKPVIPLELFSRFMDGKGYKPTSMLSAVDMKGNQMAVSYRKEDFIYLYKWKNHTFQLADTFALNITPFHLDKGKDRDSFKNQSGFSMGGRRGEAIVKSVWLLDDDKVLVYYNAGVKESERKEATMESVGENSFSLVMPDNIPADQYQLYKKGEKFGQPITLPKALSTILYIDDEYIWFDKDNESLGVEDDYAVFYKTKLKKQE